MIGLMGAMDEEVSLYVSYAEIDHSEEHAGITFHVGMMDGSEVVIAQCGIGKVSAAVTTQILIDRFEVERIILTGLAGALVPYLQQGDIVASKFLVQYDVDLTVFGRRLGDVPAVGRMLEADADMVRLVTDAYDAIYAGKSNRPQMIVGTVVSGDSFISDKRTIAWLQREFGAVATEMEGAAVAQVCQMNGKPFLVLRTISDDASDEAVMQFENNLEMAPINTFALLRQFISLCQPVSIV